MAFDVLVGAVPRRPKPSEQAFPGVLLIFFMATFLNWVAELSTVQYQLLEGYPGSSGEHEERQPLKINQ